MKRSVYLSMKTLEEARELFLNRFGDGLPRNTEILSVQEALGRVTAEPVFAVFSSPTFHSAAMDGIAVRAGETYGTTERHPKVLTVHRDARWINTGQVLPQGYPLSRKPQAARFHCSALGNVYPMPVLALNQRAYAAASYWVTPTTGCRSPLKRSSSQNSG